MRDNKVTCDCCGADLTTTGAQPAFRLCLSSEALPHRSGVINAVIVCPPIEQDVHFCNLLCLRDWVIKKWVREEAQEYLAEDLAKLGTGEHGWGDTEYG